MIGKGIEETGIGKERKKTREGEDEIETMIRKEAMTEKRRGNGQESGPRSSGGVREKRRSTKRTKKTGGIGKRRRSPRRRRSTAGAGAGKGSTGARAGAGMPGSGAGAGAETGRGNTKTKVKKKPIREVEVAAKEELTVPRSQENENIAPAKKSLGSVAGAKNVPTNEIMAIVRTSQTDRGAKA